MITLPGLDKPVRLSYCVDEESGGYNTNHIDCAICDDLALRFHQSRGYFYFLCVHCYDNLQETLNGLTSQERFDVWWAMFNLTVKENPDLLTDELYRIIEMVTDSVVWQTPTSEAT